MPAPAPAGGVVLRDEAADRQAGKIIEQWEDAIPHRPADILKIDIDAIGASLG
jgi:hypothetical protein